MVAASSAALHLVGQHKAGSSRHLVVLKGRGAGMMVTAALEYSTSPVPVVQMTV